MRRSGVGTLVVVDAQNRLEGLLTERDVRFVGTDARVAERMTPFATGWSSTRGRPGWARPSGSWSSGR